MEPDLSELDRYLEERDYDGYLIDAPSMESDQYYLSGFDTPDPFITLYDGDIHLLFDRNLENERARKESRAVSVETFADFAYNQKLEESSRKTAVDQVHAEFLRSHGVESVLVPPRSPVASIDGLRGQGIDASSDEESIITEIRAVKNGKEIDRITNVQRAIEAALRSAETTLREAEIGPDGQLLHDGEVLTSDDLRQVIEMTLLEHGCLQKIHHPIVACGAQAADPHAFGEGPLRAGETILIDIAPSDKQSHYHADMARTFVKGEPNETIEEWYELTRKAQEAALESIEAGVTGEQVHDAVCDIYEAAGMTTLRSDEHAETGFIHSTGHGVGLDVHERPRVAPDGAELEPGHVVTIEPGLYDPEVGGVRIEDLVVVTEGGYENLTDYPKELIV